MEEDGELSIRPARCLDKTPTYRGNISVRVISKQRRGDGTDDGTE
jgi:hypothetical protein